jgi:dihydrofolate reductase
MTDTTCHVSMSLDGFIAGPDQSRENPLGVGGLALHRWHLGDERATDADAAAGEWLGRPRGAYIMGRNMFGPIRGEWDEDWRGWWGAEPPYHAPVFVLTHHARAPIEMEGGTTFHFVTEGFDAAYGRALEAAGDAGIHIAGGASTVRQALAAGVVDELTLDIAPVLLGSGESIFEGVESFGFEPVEVLHSPLATHIRYRRVGTRVPRPGEASVPEIEVDETIPPRPEEEIADTLRADPDVEDHTLQG